MSRKSYSGTEISQDLQVFWLEAGVLSDAGKHHWTERFGIMECKDEWWEVWVDQLAM